MQGNAASIALLALSISLWLTAVPLWPDTGPAGEFDLARPADLGGPGFRASSLSRKPNPEHGQTSNEGQVLDSIWFERQVGSSGSSPDANSQTWVDTLITDAAPFSPGQVKRQFPGASFPTAEWGSADAFSYRLEDGHKKPSRVPGLGSTLGSGLLGLAVVVLLKRLK